MRLSVSNSIAISPGTGILARVRSFVLHVYKLRCHSLDLLIVAAVLGQLCVIMVLGVQVVDGASVAHLAVHLGSTHEFLFLGLASSSRLIICQCAEGLSRDAYYVTAASRPCLVVRMDCCFV